MVEIKIKSECCGCEACVQTCPKQCISFEQDSEGFRYPKVDKTQCVDCGLCEKVCPILTPFESRKPLRQFAAINPDNEVRKQSSSGGIFSMLAERVIHEGGVVFGVRFDENWQAVFDHVETMEGIAAFRGSKYIQARVGSAFADASKFLKEGRKVLFTGTPCQIAGLKHFLCRDWDNLLAVDFICHGTPSPRVWGMYLDEVTGNKRKDIKDIQFRNKRQGWKRFNFDMTYDEKGETVHISSWHQQNHFMRVFLQNVILRPSCHECKAKGGRSGSDITIADFWGINQLNPKLDDDQGVSLVMVHTTKGERVVNDFNLYGICDANYDDVIKFNPVFECSAYKHPKRKEFFSKLENANSVISLIDDTFIVSIKERVLRVLKRVLARFIP